MFDRRLMQNFNWGLLALTFIMSAVGILTIYSAVNAGSHLVEKSLYIRQLIWYLIGALLMIISFLFNYRLLERWSILIYIICVCMLVFVLLFGKDAGGSRRWIDLGQFSIQPSEIIKLAIIISLSGYYSKRINMTGLTFGDLLLPMIMTFIPFILIVKQPDLGTAILVVIIAASVTCFAKIEKKTFWHIIASGLVFVPMVWFFLKEYQKRRILTFLNPDLDPLGAGYHIIQSKIAIGSGLLYGKGFLKGTQNVLSFLPEQQTDFIFSVLSEEWGFLGAGFLLILFFILILIGLSVAHSCREPFGILLSGGITALLFWEVLVNVGMVMGLMPVVGVALPFISYGGSSVIIKMICIGVLLNVSMRRFLKE